MQRRISRHAHAALAMLLALLAAACETTPRADRIWMPYLAHTAHVQRLPDGAFAIHPVSDWTYDAKAPLTQEYRDVVVDPADIRGVWFLLEPDPRFRLAAHTLLLFELEDDRLLGVTVEARREAHETYSVWRGLMNAFEMSYLWATARDLLVRRAVMLHHPVYVHPVLFTEAQARALFERMLARTEALEATPRFYNTARANCTSEPLSAAGLPWSPTFIVTGEADRYLFGRGLIPGPTFADARRRADVTALVKALAASGVDAGGFDRALLTELRARQGQRPAVLPAEPSAATIARLRQAEGG